MLITLGTVDADEHGLVNQDKLIVLLSYLALEGPTSRSDLARIFWPNVSNPANNLSSTLTRLRLTQPDALDLADRFLISTSIGSDAVDLIRAANAGRHHDVANHYGGPFLSNYHLPKAGAELEQWIYTTRETLADMALRSSFALHHVDSCDWRAVELAERALETVDPLTMPTEELKRLIEIFEGTNSRYTQTLAGCLSEPDRQLAGVEHEVQPYPTLKRFTVPGCKVAIIGAEATGRRMLAEALGPHERIDRLFPGGVREVETNFQGSGTVLYEQVLSALRVPLVQESERTQWGKLLSARPALVVVHDVNPTLTVRVAIKELANYQLSLILNCSSPMAIPEFESLATEDSGPADLPNSLRLEPLWNGLGSRERAALQQLTLFAGWFVFEDLEALTDVAPSCLVRLQEIGLLETSGGQMRLPPSMKEFIGQRSESINHDQVSMFHSRLVRYLMHSTEHLDCRLPSGPMLRSNLRYDYEQLWEFLVDRADWDVLESIAFPYFKYLIATCDVAGVVRKFGEALAAVAASESPPSSLSGLRPSLNCALAWAYLAQRRDLDAALTCHQQSLDTAMTSPGVVIDFDRIRALLFKRTDDFCAAARLLERTVGKIESTIPAGLERMRLTAQVYLELGENLRLFNDIEGSSRVLRRALDAAREIGDIGLEAATYLELSKTTSISDPVLGAVLATEGLLLSNNGPSGRLRVALLHQCAEARLQSGDVNNGYREATRAYPLGLEASAYDLAAHSRLLCGLVELNEDANTVSDALYEGFAAVAMLCDGHVVERASYQIVSTLADDRQSQGASAVRPTESAASR